MAKNPYKRVAIVTGAGQGIGLAVARELLAAGHQVVLNEISSEQAEIAKHSLEFPEENWRFFIGDISSVATIKQLIDFTDTTFGRLDVLIANAGITVFNPFFEVETDAFDKVFNLNVRGTYFLVQQASNYMIDKSISGKVIVISSVTGVMPYPGLSTYSMSKAALQMMVKALAQELAPKQIRINAVAPGATLTERTKMEEEDYEGTWAALSPNGRVGYPEDIARTCKFLISEDASHIAGQTLVVDGGWTGTGNYPESRS